MTLKDVYSLLIIKQSLIPKPPLSGILVIGSIGTGQSYLVKYLTKIHIFLSLRGFYLEKIIHLHYFFYIIEIFVRLQFYHHHIIIIMFQFKYITIYNLTSHKIYYPEALIKFKKSFIYKHLYSVVLEIRHQFNGYFSLFFFIIAANLDVKFREFLYILPFHNDIGRGATLSIFTITVAIIHVGQINVT
ncbi:hypothetical protein ACJX0J_014190, partial [Zea mays]